MEGPFLLKDRPRVKFDARGLIAYAKEKGVPIENLTQEERNLFVEELSDVSNCKKIR